MAHVSADVSQTAAAALHTRVNWPLWKGKVAKIQVCVCMCVCVCVCVCVSVLSTRINRIYILLGACFVSLVRG